MEGFRFLRELPASLIQDSSTVSGVTQFDSTPIKGRHVLLHGSRRFLATAAILAVVSLLALARGGITVRSSSTQATVRVSVPAANAPAAHSQQNGAGGMGTVSTTSREPADTCTSPVPNPFDPACWAQETAKSLAQWLAQAILSALRPTIDSIAHNSLNIITQTPLLGQNGAGSPLDTTIMTLWRWAIGVVDAALAIFLILGGYTVMMRGRTQEIIDVGLHLLFAVVAANFSLLFMQLFVEIENGLCDGVIHLQQLTILTNTITSVLQGNLLGSSLLLFALGLVLGIMVLLIAWQMLVRMALLAALVVLG